VAVGSTPRALRVRHRTVDYSGGLIPGNARLANRPNLPLLITGGSVFLAGYTAAVFGMMGSWLFSCPWFDSGGCELPPSASPYMLIPGVGPWLSLATWQNTSPHTAGIAFVAIDGVVQAGGVAMVVAGAFVRHQVLVLDYLGQGTRTPERFTMAIAPGPSGASIVGTF
jgi:hypothetical protein